MAKVKFIECDICGYQMKEDEYLDRIEASKDRDRINYINIRVPAYMRGNKEVNTMHISDVCCYCSTSLIETIRKLKYRFSSDDQDRQS